MIHEEFKPGKGTIGTKDIIDRNRVTILLIIIIVSLFLVIMLICLYYSIKGESSTPAETAITGYDYFLMIISFIL